MKWWLVILLAFLPGNAFAKHPLEGLESEEFKVSAYRYNQAVKSARKHWLNYRYTYPYYLKSARANNIASNKREKIVRAALAYEKQFRIYKKKILSVVAPKKIIKPRKAEVVLFLDNFSVKPRTRLKIKRIPRFEFRKREVLASRLHYVIEIEDKIFKELSAIKADIKQMNRNIAAFLSQKDKLKAAVPRYRKLAAMAKEFLQKLSREKIKKIPEFLLEK